MMPTKTLPMIENQELSKIPAMSTSKVLIEIHKLNSATKIWGGGKINERGMWLIVKFSVAEEFNKYYHH